LNQTVQYVKIKAVVRPKHFSREGVLEKALPVFWKHGFADTSLQDNSLKRSGINIKPAHEADQVTTGMSLIALTQAAGLLPAYAQNFLPSFGTSRL
jgi:hypothetical protein